MGSLLTEEGKRDPTIRTRFGIAKDAFQGKFRKNQKSVLTYYIVSILLHSSNILDNLLAEEEKTSFRLYRRILRISWTWRVKNKKS